MVKRGLVNGVVWPSGLDLVQVHLAWRVWQIRPEGQGCRPPKSLGRALRRRGQVAFPNAAEQRVSLARAERS